MLNQEKRENDKEHKCYCKKQQQNAKKVSENMK